MAVIRQRRQVSTRGIGVVRANTGAAQQAQDLSRLADNMIESSFIQLKKQATEAGKELAEAASAADLRAIDPLTGEPKAFKIPEGYGTAATEAYNTVVKKRFASQIESDFKTKAAELAQQYQFDPDGVEKFENSFSAFADGYRSTGVVDPEVSNLVTDISSTLLASNKISLMQTRMEQEREVQIADALSSNESDINQLSSLYREGLDTKELEAEIATNIKAQQDAGLISRNQANEFSKAQSLAKATGIARKIQNGLLNLDGVDPTIVNDVYNAIRYNEQNLEDIPQEFHDDIKRIQNIGDKEGEFGFDQIASQLGSAFDAIKSDINQELILKKQKEADEKQADAVSTALEAQEVLNNLSGQRNDIVNESMSLIKSGDIDSAFAKLNEFKTGLESRKNKDGVQIIAQGTINNNVDAMRQAMIESVISNATTKDGKVVDSVEYNAFKGYLNSQGAITSEELTPEMKAMADKILSHADMSKDSATITSQSNEMLRQLANNEESKKLSKAQTESFERISNGTGSSSNSNDTDNVGSIIDQGEGEAWYVNPDNIATVRTWGETITKTNAFPTGLKNLAIRVAEGRANPEEMAAFFTYYPIFSKVRNPAILGGEPVNMFTDGVLTEDQDTTVQLAINAARFAEGGVAELPKILSVARETLSDDTKYKQRQSEVLGPDTTAADIVNEIVGENVNAFNDLIHNARYGVALGTSEKELKEVMQNVYDNYYQPTMGIVIEAGEVEVSRNSFNVMFRNDATRSRVIDIINTQIAGAQGNRDFQIMEGEILKRDEQGRVVRGTGATVASVFGTPTQDKVEVEQINRLYLQPLPFAGKSGEDVNYLLVRKTGQGKFEPFINDKNELMTFSSATLQQEADAQLKEEAILTSIAKRQSRESFQRKLEKAVEVVSPTSLLVK